MKPQIEPVTTDHLLKCLGLAVDEAKYVRQLIESKKLADSLKKDNPFSERLLYLNREIAFLEKKLAEVRSNAEDFRVE